MYVRLECPYCQAVAKVLARKAGSEVPCPDCGRPIRVPEAPVPDAVEAEAAPEPDVEWPEERRAWKSVDRGLGLVKAAAVAGFVQAVLNGLATGLWLTVGPAALKEMARPGGAGLEVETFLGFTLSLLSFLVAVVGVVCLIVGRLMCARVPTLSGARPRARAAFTSTLLALVTSLFLVYFTVLGAFSDPQDRAAWGLALLVTLGCVGGMALAGELFFLGFLARLGRALGRPDLPRAVERFVLLWVGVVVLFAAGSVLGLTVLTAQAHASGHRPFADDSWPTLLILFLAGGAFGLFLLDLYLRLLAAARDAIRQRPGASPDGPTAFDAPTTAAPGRS